MAADRLRIDHLSILNNVFDRQVEFAGEIDGERRQFAAKHEVLEALSGGIPDDGMNVVAVFRALEGAITDAALVSLARNGDQDVVTISGNDLPQTLETPPTFHPHPDGGEDPASVATERQNDPLSG